MNSPANLRPSRRQQPATIPCVRYQGSLNDRFTIDGAEFVIDISPGKDRRPSERGSFTLVKTPALIDFYLRLAEGRRVDSILELGIFQGGSLVLMDKLLKPSTFVAIEIDKPFDAITHYCEQQRQAGRNVTAEFETSQSDLSALTRILHDFPDGIDLIVDDASHTYEHTRASFVALFPHLNDGGIYVIEDWAWSHTPGHQSADHGWFKQPALTNLIFELVVETGTRASVAKLEIDRGQAIVTKGPEGGAPFVEPRLRGRDLRLI